MSKLGASAFAFASPVLLGLLAGATALALHVPAASACSCAESTPEQYVQDARLVFIGRAGADKKSGDLYTQTFEVLHAIKGEPGATFTYKRTEKNPLCGPAYKEGEIAIVFAGKGDDLGLCSGNFGLAGQADRIPAFVKAAGARSSDATLAAMKVAIAAGLKGYLHDRPNVPVVYAPLAGKTFQIGKSTLAFRASPSAGAGSKPKANSKRRPPVLTDVVIGEAFQFGPMTYVAARYDREGYGFVALLYDDGKAGPAVLYQVGGEH